MNKLILTNEDIEFLLKWRDSHKNLVRMGMSPFKAIKIVCKDSKYTVTAIADGSRITFNVTNDNKRLGKFTFNRVDRGMCELISDKSKLSEDDKQSVLTVYSSAMAFMLFGKDTINTNRTAEITTKEAIKQCSSGSKITKPMNTKRGYTYIIHFEDSNSIRSRRHPKSPKYEFTVRGHFRHYKNGKVVWVGQYVKGKGKPISTKYKLKPSKLIINFDNNN